MLSASRMEASVFTQTVQQVPCDRTKALGFLHRLTISGFAKSRKIEFHTGSEGSTGAEGHPRSEAAVRRRISAALLSGLLGTKVVSIGLLCFRYHHDRTKKGGAEAIPSTSPNNAVIDDMGVDGATIANLAEFDPTLTVEYCNGVLNTPDLPLG